MVTGIALAITALVAIVDWKWHRIPNSITYPGIVLGLLSNTFLPDGIGFTESFYGLFSIGLLMVFLFVCFPIGGADVKLISMQGAFLGLRPGLEHLLWTFSIAAAGAICYAIWKVGAISILKRLLHRLHCLLVKIPPVTNPAEADVWTQQLPLGPASFLSLIIVRFHLSEYWFR